MQHGGDAHAGTLETTRTAHVAVLAVAMLLPTIAAVLYFVVLAGGWWMRVIYFGSKGVQFGLPLVWVLAVQRRRVGFYRPEARSVLAGLLAGVLVVVVGIGAYFGYLKSSPFLERAPELVGLKVDEMGLNSPAVYLTFALFLSLPHSLLEEYYWRWFVFGELRRVTPWGAAMVLSSLGFMAHHVVVLYQFFEGQWGVTLFFSACVACGGGLWAWLYERYRSLYAPWVSHLLVDCGVMYLGYDLIAWN